MNRSPIFSNNGIVVSESVRGVVFSLKAPKLVQTPCLVAVHLLDGLKAVRIVDIGIDRPPGLTLVPLVSDLSGPVPRILLDLRVAGRNDGLDKHEVVVRAKGIAGVVGVLGVNGLGRVTLVKNITSRGELGVSGSAVLEPVEDLLLRRDVVHLQPCRGGDADMVVLTDGRVFAVALGHRDLRVGHIAGFRGDGFDLVERSEVFVGFCRGSAVGEGPRNDGFVLGDGGVHEEAPEIDQHVDGRGAVAVEGIERIENVVQLVASPDVIGVVPGVWASGEDVHLEAGHNTKVVAGTLHSPEEIAMGVFIDPDGSPVGQHHIELEEIVADHAVQAFKRSVATPQAGAHHTDAIAGASGGDISFLPKVSHGLAVVYTTPEPGRFTAGLDADVPEFGHVDLNAVEGPKALSVPVATVDGQEFKAVLIAVFDLELRLADRTQTAVSIALTMVGISDS